MWVDYKPVDDGYRSIYMKLIHERYVFQLRLKRPAKSWPDKSTCEALHRHRKGQSSIPGYAFLSRYRISSVSKKKCEDHKLYGTFWNLMFCKIFLPF